MVALRSQREELLHIDFVCIYVGSYLSAMYVTSYPYWCRNTPNCIFVAQRRLYGITALQSYNYFRDFPKDRLLLRGMVRYSPSRTVLVPVYAYDAVPFSGYRTSVRARLVQTFLMQSELTDYAISCRRLLETALSCLSAFSVFEGILLSMSVSTGQAPTATIETFSWCALPSFFVISTETHSSFAGL